MRTARRTTWQFGLGLAGLMMFGAAGFHAHAGQGHHRCDEVGECATDGCDECVPEQIRMVPTPPSATAPPPPGTEPPSPPEADLPPAPMDETAAVPPTIFEPGQSLAGFGESFASRVPGMFGDTQGGGCGVARFNGAVVAVVNHPTFGCSRTKISENNSPLPRDRAYFVYQHFHNAIDLALNAANSTTSTQSIDKYILGWERTFSDGRYSVELRVPFATQLTNGPQLFIADPLDPRIGDERSTHIGNVSAALKAILHEDCDRIISGGLLVHAPTAPDVTVRDFEIDFGRGQLNTPPTEVLNNTYKYQNESWIVSPFLATLITPNEDLFFQAFLQLEFDISGSELDFTPKVNGVVDQSRLQSIDIKQQVLMRLNLGAGYWLYRNPCGKHLTGVALLTEVHWTSTLDDAQVRVIPSRDPNDVIPVSIGNSANRQDIVNLTVGPVFELGDRANLRIGSVLPLTDREDKAFDYELNVQLNVWLGG